MSLYIAIPLLIAGAVLVLYLLYRSPPVPPMRTADHKQIEREVAGIQGSESAYDFIDELLGLVQRWAKWIAAGCAAVAALIFIASKTI